MRGTARKGPKKSENPLKSKKALKALIYLERPEKIKKGQISQEYIQKGPKGPNKVRKSSKGPEIENAYEIDLLSTTQNFTNYRFRQKIRLELEFQFGWAKF